MSGSQYLGGYIGDAGSQEDWMGEKMRYWADRVSTMAGEERRHTVLSDQ